MKLFVIKSLWGMDGSLPVMFKRISDTGYDGAEGVTPGLPSAEFKQIQRDNNLTWNNMIFCNTPAEFEQALVIALTYEPLRIPCHGGRDHMTFDEGCAFFEACLKIQQKHGVEVAFETHRGRLLYNPWETLAYLKKFPELRINADYSHWVCVAERLPDDEPEALKLANQRTIHIHGRVGYEEGPQVPDPRAPEYARYVEWHEQQWDAMRAAHEAAGAANITFCPEFGPPAYLHTLPYTQAPVADLWEICLWSAQRIRQRWSDLEQSTAEPAAAGAAGTR